MTKKKKKVAVKKHQTFRPATAPRWGERSGQSEVLVAGSVAHHSEALVVGSVAHHLLDAMTRLEMRVKKLEARTLSVLRMEKKLNEMTAQFHGMEGVLQLVMETSLGATEIQARALTVQNVRTIVNSELSRIERLSQKATEREAFRAAVVGEPVEKVPEAVAPVVAAVDNHGVEGPSLRCPFHSHFLLDPAGYCPACQKEASK